jgi:hypothetical protein
MVFKVLEAVGVQTGAFPQLTTKYMEDVFNKEVPDDESVRSIFLPHLYACTVQES